VSNLANKFTVKQTIYALILSTSIRTDLVCVNSSSHHCLQVNRMNSVHAEALSCLRNPIEFAASAPSPLNGPPTSASSHQSTTKSSSKRPTPTSSAVRFLSRLERFLVDHLNQCRQSVGVLLRSEWRSALVGYRKYIASRLADNEWLQFGRRLSNFTIRTLSSTQESSSATKLTASGWPNGIVSSGDGATAAGVVVTGNRKDLSAIGYIFGNGGTEDDDNNRDDVTDFLAFLGAFEAEFVKLWPAALLDRCVSCTILLLFCSNLRKMSDGECEVNRMLDGTKRRLQLFHMPLSVKGQKFVFKSTSSAIIVTIECRISAGSRSRLRACVPSIVLEVFCTFGAFA
jgi:hypothetical protein